MRDLGNPRQAHDPRCAFERMRLAQQAKHEIGASALFFEAQDIAAEIGNDFTRFDLKVLVEIFVGHIQRLCSDAGVVVCATIVAAMELTLSSHSRAAPEPTASVACVGAPCSAGKRSELRHHHGALGHTEGERNPAVASAQHQPSLGFRRDGRTADLGGETVHCHQPAFEARQAQQSGVRRGHGHHGLRSRQTGEIADLQREASCAYTHDEQMHQLVISLDARFLEGSIKRTFQLLEIQQVDSVGQVDSWHRRNSEAQRSIRVSRLKPPPNSRTRAGIFLREQCRGVLQLAPRTAEVALAPEHETEPQMRHRERLIEVNPDPIAVDRGRAPAALFVTQCGQVMPAPALRWSSASSCLRKAWRRRRACRVQFESSR